MRELEEQNVAFFRALPLEIQDIAVTVLMELVRAREKHAPMASAHEGYAVILEEVEELWDEVRARNRNPVAMMGEGIQVAAMGMRFLIDVVREGR